MTRKTKKILAREGMILSAIVLIGSLGLLMFSKYPETPLLSARTFNARLKEQQREIFKKGQINEKPLVLQELNAGGVASSLSDIEKYERIRGKLRTVSFYFLIFGYPIYFVLLRFPSWAIKRKGRHKSWATIFMIMWGAVALLPYAYAQMEMLFPAEGNNSESFNIDILRSTEKSGKDKYGEMNGHFLLDRRLNPQTRIFCVSIAIDSINKLKPNFFKTVYPNMTREQLINKVINFYQDKLVERNRTIIDVILSGCK